MTGKVFTGQEVAQHSSRESCWIIVHGEFRTRCEVFAGIGGLQEGNWVDPSKPYPDSVECALFASAR